MYKGNNVFATKSGKTYHYMDDDCGVSSSIMKGRTQAEEIEESEAIERGLSLCRNCSKEYAEDRRERGGLPSGSNVGCLVFILPIVGTVSGLAALI